MGGDPGPTIPFWQVDAFTTEAFRGNPAGVCVLEGPAPLAWMQAVAAEVNVAETAFLHLEGDGRWALRWLTPTMEVDLCGHATLAAAHTLWSAGLAAGPLSFSTRSGTLRAAPDGPRVALDLPAQPVAAAPAPDRLARALGAGPISWSGRNATNWLVELADPDAVAALVPDMDALLAIDAQGFIATAAGGDGSDFVSRYFAPAAGIPEDPVTGSAHCSLAGHWARRLGRPTMVGRQLSPRGGWVQVRPDGDRVHLTGDAVTVIAGTIAGWSPAG